jgi:hypothetical protein
VSGGAVRTSQSWSVGLEWSDVLLPGNALGMSEAKGRVSPSSRQGGPRPVF